MMTARCIDGYVHICAINNNSTSDLMNITTGLPQGSAPESGLEFPKILK